MHTEMWDALNQVLNRLENTMFQNKLFRDLPTTANTWGGPLLIPLSTFSLQLCPLWHLFLHRVGILEGSTWLYPGLAFPIMWPIILLLLMGTIVGSLHPAIMRSSALWLRKTLPWALYWQQMRPIKLEVSCLELASDMPDIQGLLPSTLLQSSWRRFEPWTHLHWGLPLSRDGEQIWDSLTFMAHSTAKSGEDTSQLQ